jgi:hypothetical protein
MVSGTKAFGGGPGGNVRILMNNDQGWCGAMFWGALHGSFVYAPDYAISRAPAHGEVRMDEYNRRKRVAYRPIAGFVGEDNFTIIDKMTHVQIDFTITIK